MLVGIRQVEDYEVALDYSAWSKDVDESKLYTGGTHYIGTSHRFIKYTKNLISVGFGSEDAMVVDN